MAGRLAVAAVALAALASGCGDDEGDAGSSLVDPAKRPPIHSLAANPPGDGLLLGTNRGLYRIDGDTATRIPSKAETPDGSTPVGTFLAFATDGNGLLGSGHPDRRGAVAPFLGLIRSDDEGGTWRTVSRYEFSDLHVIQAIHDRIYAYDAVLPAFLISDDGGRTWEERLGVPEPFIDFVVDPDDPDRIVASSNQTIYDSGDQGRSWSALTGAEAARLSWEEPDSLFRVDADGLVYQGEAEGSAWNLAGRIDGEPWELDAADGVLYAALRDAAIVSSADRGETWSEVFSP